MEYNIKKKIIPIEVYTDGSSKKLGQKSFGAWAFVIVKDNKVIASNSDSVPDATNQQMELLAAIEALKIVETIREKDENVIVYSDSAYFINCYSQRWFDAWKTNGWRNAKKQPVANQDLWIQLIPYFERFGFSFKKVKGHADNVFNNRCDEMAQRAADEAKIKWRGKENE